MDIMKRILEIEKKASDISDSAEEMKQQQNELIEKELAEKEEVYRIKTEESIKKLDEEAEAKLESLKKKFEREFDEKMEKLNKNASGNTNKWAEKIFNSVVNNE